MQCGYCNTEFRLECKTESAGRIVLRVYAWRDFGGIEDDVFDRSTLHKFDRLFNPGVDRGSTYMKFRFDSLEILYTTGRVETVVRQMIQLRLLGLEGSNLSCPAQSLYWYNDETDPRYSARAAFEYIMRSLTPLHPRQYFLISPATHQYAYFRPLHNS